MTSSLLKRLVQTCLGVGSSGQVAREGQDESGEVEREAIRPKGTGSGSEPNPLRHNPLEVTLLGAEPIQVGGVCSGGCCLRGPSQAPTLPIVFSAASMSGRM